MNLINLIHNRFFTPGFLINSLPKAGTNLIAKLVRLFPGIRPASVHIGQSTLNQFKQSSDLEKGEVQIGVDWPHYIPLSAIKRSLQQIKNGYYATAHIPFSEELRRLLKDIGIKTLLILRDPRDVVVSHALYIAHTPSHFLFEFYQTLSTSEQIMKSIIGVKKSTPKSPMLLNINERYQNILPWLSEPSNYTTYFEKLVGPRGYGSREAQIEEIKNIARHLNIKCNSYDIKQIAEQIFGGTDTFRKGIIGNWRNHFSEMHKYAFKELAGQLLINLRYENDLDW